MRITKKLLLGVLAALSLVAMFAPASQAQGSQTLYCVGHSSDPSYVCGRAYIGGGTPYIMDVCDHDADGHSVYGRGVYSGGSGIPGGQYYMVSGYDTNGSTQGCSAYEYGRASPHSTRVDVAAACVQSEGCGQWGNQWGQRWSLNIPHAYWNYSVPAYPW